MKPCCAGPQIALGFTTHYALHFLVMQRFRKNDVHGVQLVSSMIILRFRLKNQKQKEAVYKVSCLDCPAMYVTMRTSKKEIVVPLCDHGSTRKITVNTKTTWLK